MKTKKLVFKKETIANLGSDDMRAARGGGFTSWASCAYSEICETVPEEIFCNSGHWRCDCTGMCTVPCH